MKRPIDVQFSAPLCTLLWADSRWETHCGGTTLKFCNSLYKVVCSEIWKTKQSAGKQGKGTKAERSSYSKTGFFRYYLSSSYLIQKNYYRKHHSLRVCFDSFLIS